jgi:hypothetical protein
VVKCCKLVVFFKFRYVSEISERMSVII